MRIPYTGGMIDDTVVTSDTMSGPLHSVPCSGRVTDLQCIDTDPFLSRVVRDRLFFGFTRGEKLIRETPHRVRCSVRVVLVT